jgi:hypothetical protein
MNLRFFLILATITVTLLAWTYIHYQYQESIDARLQQLSDIPIYVYSDNSATLDSLAQDLQKGIPEIGSLTSESGSIAAQELLKKFQLGIAPNTLEEYTFPYVLTLNFVPKLTAFPAREKALDIIAKYHLPAGDVDNQEAAWTLYKNDLDFIRDRWSNSTLFTCLIVFLLFVFARLYLFLVKDKVNKGITATVIDSLRGSDTNRRLQTLLLLVVPIFVNLLVYFILTQAKALKPLVGWGFFGIQSGVVLTATLVTAMLHNMRETEDSEHTAAFSVDINHRSNAADS